MSIADRMMQFKSELVGHSPEHLVQRYVIDGHCYALSDSKHFDLRRHVASHFSIAQAEVIVVGSGKLGFSIAPNKRYQEFGDTSDIDLAVVSSELFNMFWDEAFKFWCANQHAWADSGPFSKYLFRGKIWPKLLPSRDSLTVRKEVDEYFEELTRSQLFGDFPIGAHIYRSWHHLEQYHATAVRMCQIAAVETITL